MDLLDGFAEAVELPFVNLDLSLAALFGWINLIFAALSKAEKAAWISFAPLVVLAFLSKAFSVA